MATYYLIYERDELEGVNIDGTLYPTYEEAYEVVKGLLEVECGNLNSDASKEKAKEKDGTEIGDIDDYRRTFFIREMKVVSKKPTKKYVYQYWVENKICGLHTKSGKYASFDEVCDALDNELRELHAGSYWEPRMPRDEFRAYMGDGIAATYDFFKEDKYVLSRQEA